MLMSGIVQCCFLFSVFGGSVWVFVFGGRESWTHCWCIVLWMCFSLYALKLLSRNRTTEQSNKTIFLFFFLVWELLSQWTRNNVFTVGEIILVFIPYRKRFWDSVHYTFSVLIILYLQYPVWAIWDPWLAHIAEPKWTELCHWAVRCSSHRTLVRRMILM